MTDHIIDNRKVEEALNKKTKSPSAIRQILAKAREMKGLNLNDVATLTTISDPQLIEELFSSAKQVKEEIYGNRLVIFAPLYISNLCSNDCAYCAFRLKNKALKRRALNQQEIAAESKALIKQGHKRILLVAGEAYPQEGFSYVLKAIDTIYQTKSGTGEIRRINVNVAPLTVDEFKQLKERNIGTYQLFQETYHLPTYNAVHLKGKKSHYGWRIEAMDRAMEAGIDDLGIGVLFGLTDWRLEILFLLQHVEHLENKFGVGPHTVSVPRLEPASGSDIASHPPKPVSDFDFRKIVAILRLAIPYTGIIMSTRETPNIRRETFALGVSQISAGSRTNPGGYNEEAESLAEQFSLGDHRPLDEVILDIIRLGYIPSFCTGCYRLGRTGADFMDLAKPGAIKEHCNPNAISTFLEYLLDFASPATKEAGENLIKQTVKQLTNDLQNKTKKMIAKVREGKRDVYC